MKIGAQLYTVRDRLHDASSLRDVLQALHEIGYAAVEVAGVAPSAQEDLAGALMDAGLVACAAHVSLDALIADLPLVAARCAAWGCDYIVIPSAPVEYQSSDGYGRLAEVAVQLARQLAPHGLRLAYHNHDFELAPFDGRTGLEILYQAAPAEALQAELDTYWLQYTGGSPAAWIARLAGRLPLVHVKDMAITGGERIQTEVGQGVLDWRGILDACRRAGTEWLIVEQDECRGDPLESLSVSYSNLTRLISAP